MIRTTAVPATRRTRASARTGVAAASVLGVIALAGCASAADAEESASTQTDAAATPAATASAPEAQSRLTVMPGTVSGRPASTGSLRPSSVRTRSAAPRRPRR